MNKSLTVSLKKQWTFFVLALLLVLPSLACATTTLHVGFTDNRPAVFRDASGAPQGIYVDVLGAIARQEGWVLEYHADLWASNLKKVESGEIDLLVDIAATPERASSMAFSSVSLVEDWARIFVAPDLAVVDFSDLEAKRIGLVRGDIHTGVFLQITKLLGIQPIVVLTESNEASMDLLALGEIEALVLPNLQSKVIQHRVTCVKTDLIFNPVELRFAAPLDANPDILTTIDAHVARLKQDPSSVYHRSMTKWVEGVGRIVIPKWLNAAWLIGGVGGLLVLVVLFNILLRYQVRIKTKALALSIAVQQKQDSELGVAKDIQLGLLPALSLHAGDYNLAAYLEPAKMVGGDFFDFFKLKDNRLCFLIADVADKGIPAALFMASTKTCLSVMADDVPSVADLMTAVNRRVADNNPRCMFVTMFCGVLDLDTGVLCYTLAGHDPPFLCRQDGALQVLRDAHCMALGLDEDAPYEQAEVTIQPGDRLFMFTDGVSEAVNDRGEQFGEEAIAAVLSGSLGGESAQAVSAMKDAVELHVGTTPAHDDITMLCLCRKEAEVVHIDIDVEHFSMTTIVPQIEGFLRACHCGDELLFAMHLVVEELLVNVVTHGKAPEVALGLSFSSDCLQVEVIDNGAPFNPLKHEVQGLDDAFADRDVGGMGIHLVKEMMDELIYTYKDGKNRLRAVKQLGS